MNRKLLYFVFILSIFISNKAISSEGIYYIDMDYIMNNSLAGKSIVKQLEKKNNSYSETIKKIEADLKKEETKLISQKNILDSEEFKKRALSFQEKVTKYRNDRKENSNNLTMQKNKAQQNLIMNLTPILGDYAKKNSISFILPKQSIIIGKSELDLTNKILEILNEQIKTIELK
jgi:outer membrane protein